jgi:hypothetical protein
MFKEILITAVAVMLGVILANILAKKVPFLSGSWEQWEES